MQVRWILCLRPTYIGNNYAIFALNSLNLHQAPVSLMGLSHIIKISWNQSLLMSPSHVRQRARFYETIFTLDGDTCNDDTRHADATRFFVLLTLPHWAIQSPSLLRMFRNHFCDIIGNLNRYLSRSTGVGCSATLSTCDVFGSILSGLPQNWLTPPSPLCNLMRLLSGYSPLPIHWWAFSFGMSGPNIWTVHNGKRAN